MTSLITDFLKLFTGVLHFGLNLPTQQRKAGKRVVIFKNKYNCANPYVAEAWLVVDKWKKTYIYPFDCMDHCLCEASSLLYNHAIFDRDRHPIQIGGYGFRSGLCKEVGIKWLNENFKTSLNTQKLTTERYVSSQPHLSIKYENQ